MDDQMHGEGYEYSRPYLQGKCSLHKHVTGDGHDDEQFLEHRQQKSFGMHAGEMPDEPFASGKLLHEGILVLLHPFGLTQDFFGLMYHEGQGEG